ncbi:glycosyltransferase, partial [Zavarzinia sp.]|uniref:glycosyltransferase n=1 Tax=Zavarzinia sp. TaxID=2027920 RepID=UPI003BB58F7C
GLERLMAALSAQSCRPRAVVFTVESVDDPAHGRIAALAAPLPVSVVVAGETVAGSQKCRNLAAALRLHGEDAPFIVLADADIEPPRDWLAHLLRPLARGAADIVTGYRWPVPGDAGLATILGTWADRAVAGLPKPNRGWLTWGGSLALKRDVVRTLDLPALFEREISDDLALAGAARRAGLKIIFRGAVLVPTPFRHSLASLLGFGRRQYQMFLLYQPWLWAWAGLTLALNLFGSVSLWLLALRGGWGLVAFGLGAGIVALADGQRRRLARRAGIASTGQRMAERASRLLPLVLPLVHGVNLLAFLLSLDRRRVVWGHCTYRLRAGRVVAIERRAPR